MNIFASPIKLVSDGTSQGTQLLREDGSKLEIACVSADLHITARELVRVDLRILAMPLDLTAEPRYYVIIDNKVRHVSRIEFADGGYWIPS